MLQRASKLLPNSMWKCSLRSQLSPSSLYTRGCCIPRYLLLFVLFAHASASVIINANANAHMHAPAPDVIPARQITLWDTLSQQSCSRVHVANFPFKPRQPSFSEQARALSLLLFSTIFSHMATLSIFLFYLSDQVHSRNLRLYVGGFPQLVCFVPWVYLQCVTCGLTLYAHAGMHNRLLAQDGVTAAGQRYSSCPLV